MFPNPPSAPGLPPPAPAMAPMAPPPPAAIPMTEDQWAAWKRRLKASLDPIKTIITDGKVNVQRYRGKHLTITPTTDTVVVPLDYSYVEQKKAQLLPQLPELQLEALRPDTESATPVAQAVLNQKLGPAGVDAKTMMFEVLTDALLPTGYAVTKIGYENTTDGTQPIVVGQEPVPVQQPGAILNLQPDTQMQDVIQRVPHIVSERYYWERMPPGFFRCPADFRGSDFDKAPWLAFRFAEDLPDGQEDRGTSHSEDDDLLLIQPPQQTRGAKRYGTEVWYQAARFDTGVTHPDIIRMFTLYDDDQEPPVKKDSPFQRRLPDGTLIGMRGYPIHVLTLRYLPDSCFPPSDATMSRQQVDELSKGRTQMVQRRDRALPQTGYDATRILPDTLAKIQKNENTALVGVNGPVGDAFSPINKGDFKRENFEFDSIIKQDLDQIWALGANAGVLRAESPETATKSNLIQSSVQSRLEAERTRALEFLTKGAMKLFALCQLFQTDQDYVRIVGPDASELKAWDLRTIAGDFVCKAKPDSHLRFDAAQDRQQALSFYNLTANDPYANRPAILKMVAEKFGLDPAKVMKQPDPKGPDPASATISIKLEDFLGPQAPIAQTMAQAFGIQIPPQAMQAVGLFAQMWQQMQAQAAAVQAPTSAQTAHGGAAEQMPPISQHEADITGGMPRMGVQ